MAHGKLTPFPCFRCGTPVMRYPSQTTDRLVFCSKECRWPSRKPAPNPDDPTGETMLVPLTRGFVAIIDAADAEQTSALKWRAIKGHSTHYAIANVSAHQTISLHRYLTDAPPDIEVDHENRNGLDCRRSNLRLATKTQNHGNTERQSNNTSGRKGVTWDAARQKWAAQIRCKGINHALGRYDTAAEAAAAYRGAALILFGEFSRTD